jgi:hypothetical protein
MRGVAARWPYGFCPPVGSAAHREAGGRVNSIGPRHVRQADSSDRRNTAFVGR